MELKQPAIVTSVLFGKYERSHVCNLRKFKIFGGMSEESMIELLDAGLKNDSVPETFELRCKLDSSYFPCRFLRIEPSASWGPSFNFSIWYVALYGCLDETCVQPSLNWFETVNHKVWLGDRSFFNLFFFSQYRERVALRLCLKHLRERNCMDAYNLLQKQTGISLEDPFVTDLHQAIVVSKNLEFAEKLIEKAAEGIPEARLKLKKVWIYFRRTFQRIYRKAALRPRMGSNTARGPWPIASRNAGGSSNGDRYQKWANLSFWRLGWDLGFGGFLVFWLRKKRMELDFGRYRSRRRPFETVLS